MNGQGARPLVEEREPEHDGEAESWLGEQVRLIDLEEGLEL